MANLSNINNILRTDSLGVGINRDPLGVLEVSSATRSGIKMFNTGASGKTYETYVDASGNYIIYDEDASRNDLVISSGGDATFSGNVTLASDKKVNVGASSYIERATSGTKLILRSSDDMLFQPGSSTKLTLEAGGNATFGSIVTTDKIFVAKGQNVSHGASQLKISQENTTKSQIRFYGADASTAGILEFQGSSSDGSVGDTRLTLNADGSSTFAGTVLIDGVSNYTGLTVKGSGASRPAITWSNVNQGDLGIIYGTESNALVIATGASGLAALTIDSSQNSTFAGNVDVGKDVASANSVVKSFTTGHAVANRGGSILFGMNDSTPTGMTITTSAATNTSYNK